MSIEKQIFDELIRHMPELGFHPHNQKSKLRARIGITDNPDIAIIRDYAVEVFVFPKLKRAVAKSYLTGDKLTRPKHIQSEAELNRWLLQMMASNRFARV